MQLTIGPYTAIIRKIGTPAVSEHKNIIFLRISLIYYLFSLKNNWFKFVKLNSANKVRIISFSAFKVAVGSMYTLN